MSKGCVIFDFDGVIADTEALHLAAYNHTFAAHAADIGGPLEIPPALYFSRYIVFSDREGFYHILRDHDRPYDPALVARLSAAKEVFFETQLHTFAEPLPGVRDLLTFLEQHTVPRAICSGARRAEILPLLDAFELRHHFDVIVTSEDVRAGKPHPEGYARAFDLLNLEYDAELDKNFSLAIEDSAGGCSAARAAGLRVLGVATSLPMPDLKNCATFTVERLTHLDPSQLKSWLGLHD